MSSEYSLPTGSGQGGCSSKLPALFLDNLLQSLPFTSHPDLLVGVETSDDAAVWKIDEQAAAILTVDFFPPICPDPFEFGQIAAANALSDIFAMGGRVLLALNLVMFPAAGMDPEILREILRGGLRKTVEAGGILAGGHTIDDTVPKYGLAVMGLVHPERIISNRSARQGELLILTKPIGSGVILAGRKIGEADEEAYMEALEGMKLLNKNAAETMQRHDIRCATDITGFGLLGHALRIAEGSSVSLKVNGDKVPLLSGALKLAENGCIPGAAFRNQKFVEEKCTFGPKVIYERKMLLLDAQTSGGILMCCPREKEEAVLGELRRNGYSRSEVIGEVLNPEGAPGITVV